MRDKLIKRFVIGTFVSLYLLVSVISTIHVIDFFELSNPYWLAVTLAIGFEIGAAASLASLVILKKMNRTIVWSLFIAITLMQMQGNMYYAFINLTDFSSWSELFNLIEEDLIYQKRILAFVSGAILPLIALGFIKSLVDYIKPEDEDNETLTSGVMDDNMLSESNDGFDTQPSEEYFEDIESWDNTLMDGLEELEDEEDEEFDEDHAHDMVLNNMIDDMTEEELQELFENEDTPKKEIIQESPWWEGPIGPDDSTLNEVEISEKPNMLNILEVEEDDESEQEQKDVNPTSVGFIVQKMESTHLPPNEDKLWNDAMAKKAKEEMEAFIKNKNVNK